jgi:putative transposase
VRARCDIDGHGTIQGLFSPMSELPVRRTERLYHGRAAVPEATYFVTFVTKYRVPWLKDRKARDAVVGVLRDWHFEGDGKIRAAVVMPDHVHVLCVPGTKLTIGRCISRWKNQSMRASEYAGKWQRDFWEHRIRSSETIEDYGLYMLLNPYRAGLASPGSSWPGWWLPDSKLFRFSSALDERGSPPREWLEYSSERFEDLALGESAAEG